MEADPSPSPGRSSRVGAAARAEPGVHVALTSKVKDAYFTQWLKSQEEVLREIEEYFAPVPIKRVPLFTEEVLGTARLEKLAAVLYPDGEDPAALTRVEKPYTFAKENGCYQVRLQLPFATKGEIGLFKKGDELIVEIGTLRRHIGLPTSMAGLTPSRARLDHKLLIVEMKEASS